MPIELKPWQTKPSQCMQDALAIGKGVLLIAPTRTGKTFAIADALVRAQSQGIIPFNPEKLADVVFLTAKTAKIQSYRVLKQAGLKNFMVESYAALRSSLGELMFIDWRTELIAGEATEVPHWREDQKPSAIICDECQGLRNVETLQTQIVIAAIKAGITVIFASATPYNRLSETFTVLYGLGLAVTKRDWEHTVQDLAGYRTKPDEYNHEAMKRLDTWLVEQGKVIKFENITYKHKTINKCKTVDFEKPEHALIYAGAHREYLEKLRKINRHEPGGIAAIWTAWLMFRMKADLLKAGIFAKEAKEDVDNGFQVIIASGFIETLRATWGNLVKQQGFKANEIGFIIGAQKEAERQEMIDKFQRGTIKVLLMTQQAGGVGISLHHEFDFPAVRPRKVKIPPPWSAIQLVQVLGRAHGPTSLSTTHQDVICLRGTIEETRVKPKLELKMRSLKQIVTKRETWTDLFNDSEVVDTELEEIIAKKTLQEQTEVDETTGEVIEYDVEALES